VLAGCSRPPCRCVFPRCAVPNGIAIYTMALGGRRLTQAVGQAACSACDLQFSSSARASTHNA
jgi:hypothetical protein